MDDDDDDNQDDDDEDEDDGDNDDETHEQMKVSVSGVRGVLTLTFQRVVVVMTMVAEMVSQLTIQREKLLAMKRYSGFLKRPEILETVYRLLNIRCPLTYSLSKLLCTEIH